jgi:ABC-type uncharacterized transport system ATPase subunit
VCKYVVGTPLHPANDGWCDWAPFWWFTDEVTVLIDTDFLLLDEPINHLDEGTVEWLTDYLLHLHDTTVITISHGTFLIDFICSTVLPLIARS